MKHWIVSLILFLVIVSSILFIRGNYSFNKIGLSQDFNPNQGIEHLMKFEISFNEISTGNNWRNTTIEKYTNNTFRLHWERLRY
ncbi:MAG: hypothetical protein ABJI33_06645 [Balneola sp.]